MTGGHLNPMELKLDEILGNDDNSPIPESTPNATPTPTNDPSPDPTPALESNEPVIPSPESTPPAPSNEERFTANQIAEKEEPTESPVAPTPTARDPETQYIIDNLPEISATIVVDGKAQNISVKSWTQLPENVEFASKRDELAFMNALTAQENTARELQNTYRTQRQQTQVQEFEARENTAIQEDLSKLQNEDKLPKLLAPNDPKFADDPATKEVQSVLDYMNEVNAAGLERYNKGGAYAHITFEQAYNMMPKSQEANTRAQRQTQEDQERKDKAGNVAGNTGSEGPLNIRKPTVRQGITLDQIADRIENEW